MNETIQNWATCEIEIEMFQNNGEREKERENYTKNKEETNPLHETNKCMNILNVRLISDRE